jgi:hypothetical protein
MAQLSESTEIQLTEEYIQLQTGKNRGVGFYPIMVDTEERPYLDIEDVLKNVLSLLPECKIDLLYCQVPLHFKRKTFWIDGKNKEFGDQLELSTPLSLPENALIMQGDKLWLRYDIWSRWLPINTSWSVNEYRLSFLPRFPLLDELAKSRQEHRKLMAKKYEKYQTISKKTALQPEGSFRPELRYQVIEERFIENSEDSITINSTLNVDLWQGTFKVGGSLSQYRSEEETIETSDSYWNYKRRHLPGFEVLELGDMRLGQTILMPAMVVDNGLRIDHIENKAGISKLKLQGSTTPGTEIDLYHNGLLISTIFVGDDGNYTFDEYSVPGGEYVRLVFFHPDGSREEEIIKVAPDNGWILQDDDWNMRLFTGEKEWGRISRVDVSTGLTDSSTFGLQAYSIQKD